MALGCGYTLWGGKLFLREIELPILQRRDTLSETGLELLQA